MKHKPYTSYKNSKYGKHELILIHMWESKQQYLLMDKRGGYNLVIDLVSPSPTESQPHDNANLSSSMLHKSTPQLKFHQCFSTQILPYQTLRYVLNL